MASITLTHNDPIETGNKLLDCKNIPINQTLISKF